MQNENNPSEFTSQPQVHVYLVHVWCRNPRFKRVLPRETISLDYCSSLLVVSRSRTQLHFEQNNQATEEFHLVKQLYCVFLSIDCIEQRLDYSTGYTEDQKRAFREEASTLTSITNHQGTRTHRQQTAEWSTSSWEEWLFFVRLKTGILISV